jgi:hypothetical protein
MNKLQVLLNEDQRSALELHIFAIPGMLELLNPNSTLDTFDYVDVAVLSVWNGHDLNEAANEHLFKYLEGRMAYPSMVRNRASLSVPVLQLRRLFNLERWHTPLTAEEQLAAIIKFGIRFTFEEGSEDAEDPEDWSAAGAGLMITGFSDFKGGYHHAFLADNTMPDRLAALESVIYSIVTYNEPYGRWLHKCRELDTGTEWSSWQPTSDFVPKSEERDEEDENEDEEVEDSVIL